MPLVDPITMSTPSTAAAASSSKETDILPASPPVHVLANPQAQTGAQIQPAVLLALFLLRFRSLVADPVSEMTNALPVVAAIQIGYAVLCLPAAGSSAGKKGGHKSRPGEKQVKSGKAVEDGAPNVAVTAVVAFVIAVLSILPLYIILILFGAAFLSYTAQTLLTATHFSLLTLFPLLYTRGVDSSPWLEILSFRASFDEVFGGLVGATAGAWLGAVPIPLDWDREWQKWPVTILAGIYGGYVLGKLVGGYLVFGKRFG